MSAEADAEAMAMPYSAGALNGLEEARDMGGRGEADFHVIPPAVEAPKASVPVLDLLHWSEAPYPNPSRARFSATNDSSAFRNASDESPFVQPSVVRTCQPAGGVSTISFGTNFTLEESDQSQRRRPGSDSKRREMRGSRIFEQETASESVPDLLPEKPLAVSGLPTPQRASSQNAHTKDLDLTPKKPTSLSEMAKQRELSGTFFGATDTPSGRRPCSSAKSRELEGSNIFGRSTQDQPNTRPPKYLATDFAKAAGADHQENYAPVRTSVKVSNPAGGRSQISFGNDEGEQQAGMQSKKHEHKQKAAELSGSHNILKCETNIAVSNKDGGGGSTFERGVSAAKRREMLGNDIFSDASPVSSQERPRRVRQPPGGDSNLKLF